MEGILGKTEYKMVVQTVNLEERPYANDFHLIDLKERNISMNFIPSITNPGGHGQLVAFSCDICVMGGIPRDNQVQPECESENGHTHIHVGASRYSYFGKCWNSIRLPNSLSESNPAVICSKMYCFGATSAPLRPELLKLGRWKELELPSELKGRHIYPPVITDTDNSRIIVYVPDTTEFYAFKPPSENSYAATSEEYLSLGGPCGGTWTKLAIVNIDVWYPVVAVSDDIIYFHSDNFDNLLRAFDLRSKTWLKVVANMGNVKLGFWDFNVMFALPGGKGLMCLAAWLPWLPSSTSPEGKTPPSVDFLTFTVKRTPDSSLINLQALDYQSYSIPSAMMVSSILMLQDGFGF